MLESIAADLHEASDGGEALRAIGESQPDILIIDLLMPGVEGLEAIAAVRRRWPQVAIIAMTGGGIKGDFRFLPMAEKLGADASLQKPFTARQLAEAVAEAVTACAARQSDGRAHAS